jgi:hypothetical protein
VFGKIPVLRVSKVPMEPESSIYRRGRLTMLCVPFSSFQWAFFCKYQHLNYRASSKISCVCSVAGVMKIEDMKWLYKGVKNQLDDMRSYIVSLLQKFEVALLWDHDNLMIPSLLPTEADLNVRSPDSPDILVRIVTTFYPDKTFSQHLFS